jgi:hypothetical protein
MKRRLKQNNKSNRHPHPNIFTRDFYLFLKDKVLKDRVKRYFFVLKEAAQRWGMHVHRIFNRR